MRRQQEGQPLDSDIPAAAAGGASLVLGLEKFSGIKISEERLQTLKIL